MAVNFPLNPVDEQRYPDLAAGDAPLENGRVYVYDAGKGIWNLDTSEGSNEFLLKHGHEVDDCTAPVVYSWNEDATFKSENSLTLDTPKNFTVNSDYVYLNAEEDIQISADQEIVIKGGTDLELTAGDNYSEFINRTIEDTDSTKQITNKEYVDHRDHILQEEIIKIQEEINALAPSTDRGIWKDAATQIPPEGHFSMRVSGGGVTADYTNPDISLLVIHRTDSRGGYHSFEKDEIGDEIQLFDVEDQNFGVFEITGKDDQSSADYVSFDVKHLGGLGGTKPEDDVIVRLYKPPSGGTASEFVRKLGDNMEGPLVFKDSGIIDGSNAQSMPENPGDPSNPGYRAGLEIRTVADKPIAISHNGSYKSVLEIYRYDTNEPNGRGKTLYMTASGNVITPGYFQTRQYVETPIVQSKSTEDLKLKRGGSVKVEIKSNLVEVSDPLQVSKSLRFIPDGTDDGKVFLYYNNNPGVALDQKRIQFLDQGSHTDALNTGGGSLLYKRDSLVSDALTWGKDGITLYSYADKKLDIGQCPVINVPDPVDEQDATNKRYVDLLSAKIEELEAKIANLGGGSGSMSRNIRFEVTSTSSSLSGMSGNTIKVFNSRDPFFYICLSGIALKPQGLINITEVNRGTTGPIHAYHITDVENNSLTSQKEQIVKVSIAQEGATGNGGSFGFNTPSQYYVSLVDGAWDDETPVSSSVRMVTTSGSFWDSSGNVADTDILYMLNSSGNLSNGSYAYGAFIPIPYLEKESGLKYMGLRDNASGKFGGNTTQNVEEATLNGVKGVKVWGSSSYYYTNTIHIHIYGANMLYIPDS